MLEAIGPMPDGLKSFLQSRLVFKTVKRKENLLDFGKVCRNVTFILEGSFRCFHIDDEGNEICSWFMKSGAVIIVVDSYYLEIPSNETIQTMTKSLVCSITREQVREACTFFPEFYQHVLFFTEKYYTISYQEKRLLRMRCCAQERLNFLLEIFPDLLSWVPKKYIASYLGISKWELSRIKL